MKISLPNGREILQHILDRMDDGVLVVDEKLSVVFTNQRLRTMFHVANATVGRDVMEIVLDHRIRDVIKAARDTQGPCSEEIHLAPSEWEKGRELVLMVEAEPLPPRKLHPPLIRAILRDETARHEIEQIRRDFVANASHELRTPLSIINGYIENLMEGAIDQPDLARRFLGVMKKHGERIARIVEDMLTLSKFESPAEDPLRSGVFDLRSCLADVLERLQPLIEERKATVAVDAPGAQIPMAGDRFYWDQIFFNLIDNALKQNLRPGLKITISCQDRGESYLLKIADNGVGIPTASLPFIFKRFYRVEKHHSQEIKGTGLGLSIVKRAIEAHRGTVRATSIPGEETAFLIEVPKGLDEVHLQP